MILAGILLAVIPALIVPVMSFLNCTMDWEWKYGYEDFQDRFSADLTVAESIGRQVGAWPTILAGAYGRSSGPSTCSNTIRSSALSNAPIVVSSKVRGKSSTT